MKNLIKTAIFGTLCWMATTTVAVASLVNIDAFINGNTFEQDFIINNNSGSGIKINSFTLDLRPLSADNICFELSSFPCSGLDNPSVFFTLGEADTRPTDDSFVSDMPGGNTGALDFLFFAFADFDPLETLGFRIGVANSANGALFGSDLIGALMTFNLSDGNSYLASFAAGTEPQSAQLSVSSSIDAELNAPATLAFFIATLVMIANFRFKQRA